MDDEAPPPQSHPGQGFSRLLPWLLSCFVLAGGFTATFFYWDYTHQQEQAATDIAFHAAARRVVTNISHKLNTYQVVMRGVQGFFLGSDQVSFEEFTRYTSSLNIASELKGVLGVAYAVPVKHEDMGRHLEDMGAQLPVDYHIHPPGSREFHAPIVYFNPLSGDNSKAIGYDLYANPIAREAIEKARDSGQIVISSPISLVQDSTRDRTPSFVMYLPVYRAGTPVTSVAQRRDALIGWIDVPFRMRDFMAVLQSEINPHIDVEIHDGAHDSHAPPGEGLLFDADSISHQERCIAGELATTARIDVGTRMWTLLLSSTPEFRSETILSSRAPLVATTGTALSLAFALLVLVIARGRDKSERRAARMGHLYHALSEVNQAIVRMETEVELFPLVCRMAVEFGGMKMAWVGRLDETTGMVTPVASHGAGTGYLSGMTISARAGIAEGEGPTGKAIRENQPVIINDYLGSPITRPWHERARQYGWKSSGAFPVPRNGKPFAVLNVYHPKAGAFDENAINLFMEMSSDISFALDNFDREDQRLGFEKALVESESRLSTILESVGACIYLKDTSGRYLFVNQPVLDLWGARKDDVIGFGDEKFFDDHTVARIRENDRLVFEKGEVLEKEEIDTVKATGVTKTYWSVKLPLRRADGTIYALCGISTDITEHKAREEKIRYLSSYDSLTGLPNRELLEDKTRIALASAKASGTQVCLMCINLDRFKIINDSLGHSTGDSVLRELSRRLTAELHLDSTLTRLSGDDFILLLPWASLDQAATLAQQLLRIISSPIHLNGHRLAPTASIGIACFPDHGRNFEQLVQSADAALFSAKQKGPGNYQVFDQLMRAQADETLQIENELREALENNQLVLHYQPQVDMVTGRISGVEALVRWQHPEKGLIPPVKFIPVAEQSGLIIDIGNWVMQTAARQQAAWHTQGLPVASVAVNLSAVQLYRDNFFQTVESVLSGNNLSRNMLELELTESIAMEHSTRTLTTLRQLQVMGVTLTIDDFGTGYSSMSYLKRYPVHKLKIDKSFVDGLATNPEDQAIVVAIIGVAKGLGFKTVAEGVETKEQWQFLRDHGCDAYQGYYYSKPLPAQAVTELLQAGLL